MSIHEYKKYKLIPLNHKWKIVSIDSREIVQTICEDCGFIAWRPIEFNGSWISGQVNFKEIVSCNEYMSACNMDEALE